MLRIIGGSCGTVLSSRGKKYQTYIKAQGKVSLMYWLMWV